MRLILPLLFLLLTGFQTDPAKIIWGTKTITWDDYRGKKERGVARTYYDIEISIKPAGNNQLTAAITCVFFSSDSWTILKDDLLLEHEVGHFDLAEVFARKIRQRIGTATIKKGNAEKQIYKIYYALMDELDREQNRYDKETDSSMDKPQQKKWTARIGQEIGRLEPYASPTLTIHLQ